MLHIYCTLHLQLESKICSSRCQLFLSQSFQHQFSMQEKKMFHTSHSLDLITKTESVIILGCFLRDVSVTKIWFGIVGLQSRTVASCWRAAYSTLQAGQDWGSKLQSAPSCCLPVPRDLISPNGLLSGHRWLLWGRADSHGDWLLTHWGFGAKRPEQRPEKSK